MADAVKNFAYSTVATAPAPAASGTSLIVAVGDGAKFPAAVPYSVSIWPAGAQPTATNAEIATVTALVGDTLTIVRAAEGSSARTVVIGDQIAETITAKDMTDLAGELAPSTDQIIQPGFSKYVPGTYEIASGKKLEIGLLAVMEIG